MCTNNYIAINLLIFSIVSAHQDSTFLHTAPLSCSALWFPLEDCSVANGCLYAIPGSHKGLFELLFFSSSFSVSHKKTEGVHNDRRFVKVDSHLEFTNPPRQYDSKDFVPFECKAGAYSFSPSQSLL